MGNHANKRAIAARHNENYEAEQARQQALVNKWKPKPKPKKEKRFGLITSLIDLKERLLGWRW